MACASTYIGANLWIGSKKITSLVEKLWLKVGAVYYALKLMNIGGIIDYAVEQSATTPAAGRSYDQLIMVSTDGNHVVTLTTDDTLIVAAVDQTTTVDPGEDYYSLKANDGNSYKLKLITDSGFTFLAVDQTPI